MILTCNFLLFVVFLSAFGIRVMPFAATWMDLEIVILSEVSQTEKDRIVGYGLYVKSKKKKKKKEDTNELIYKMETDSQT